MILTVLVVKFIKLFLSIEVCVLLLLSLFLLLADTVNREIHPRLSVDFDSAVIGRAPLARSS